MKEYHKIQSVYKRDDKTHKFIEGEYSLPEFEYLKDNVWTYQEKINGTNCRVMWDGINVRFGGKTNDAQMPTNLFYTLHDMFPVEKFKTLYPDTPMCLYGEGYGAKLAKGGGNYISNGVSFILFDVLIDTWWLEDNNVQDIAGKLNIKTIPIVGEGTLDEAEKLVRNGLKSTFGDFLAEGLVLRPKVDLFSRNGHRIITKMKYRDW